MILRLILLYLLCLQFIESARILGVFPTPSISHQVVFRVLTHELARRGHELTVITTDPVHPNEVPENLTQIDVHDLSYSRWNKVISEMEDGSRDVTKQVEAMMNLNFEIFEEQVKCKSVQKLLSYKHDHFDLIIVEAFLLFTLGFSHVFKAPVIWVSSFAGVWDNYEAIGAPSHPFLYPVSVRDKLNNITMWEKINQLRKEYKMRNLNRNNVAVNKLLKKLFGEDTPPIQKLFDNVAMLFLNVHPIWDSNRPVPPGVIYMGGLHQNPIRELPKDLKLYLDSSKNGVIYFSLGTNVKPSYVPPEKLQAIINVFSRLPYEVLWKWDNELLVRSNNIKISKWLPQSDILRHPKVKLFITQGGLQSTDEAITAGVPLVGIPLLADQWFNVDKYVQHKIGVRIDIDTLTEEMFENAIRTVINDTSYRENILRLRSIMQDQPQSPLERAVWWTEHVLRHRDARHLRSPAANISWTQYLELELVFTLASVLILSLVILFVVLKIIWNYITSVVTTKIKKS
ncbi:PREDICTED: UDP-glucuronosyltransferase 2B19-like isoform X2 [Papilio xuthus]|uniref:UDP-glucuronosyltransferase n=1 Tax=Papilio xuthus TaxID=66420 RepID=A0AAJ6ZBE4_PAPXU|nr:PREDICTED: UDP-glucuronosyltransferase 2B19-like isoform X2 [Papilio xuthus]